MMSKIHFEWITYERKPNIDIDKPNDKSLILYKHYEISNICQNLSPKCRRQIYGDIKFIIYMHKEKSKLYYVGYAYRVVSIGKSLKYKSFFRTRKKTSVKAIEKEFNKRFFKLYDDFSEEYDSSAKAWKYYKIKYDAVFVGFNHRFLKSETQRNIKQLAFKEKPEMKFALSGDLNFNFKDNHCRKFNLILDELLNKSQKKEYQTKLFECRKNVYSENNISLMPTFGGLNNLKKGISNDRVDVFIYVLDQYFKYRDSDSNEGVNLIFGNCYSYDYNMLCSYLSCFDDIYDYCKRIYFFNKELVDRALELARHSMCTPEIVMKYIDFTLDVWKAVHNYEN